KVTFSAVQSLKSIQLTIRQLFDIILKHQILKNGTSLPHFSQLWLSYHFICNMLFFLCNILHPNRENLNRQSQTNFNQSLLIFILIIADLVFSVNNINF
ncbi:transmembrane protein, putative, partial (macronuclear) [Tetrahymena thermophila SB210]